MPELVIPAEWREDAGEKLSRGKMGLTSAHHILGGARANTEPAEPISWHREWRSLEQAPSG